MNRRAAALLSALIGVALPVAAQSAPEFIIDRPELEETSGLAASRQNPGWIWAHNDSGCGPWLVAIDPRRRARFRVRVSSAKAMDWEDLELAPGPDGRDWLWIADTGRNLAHRSREPARLWVVPEPVVGRDFELEKVPAPSERLPFFRSRPAYRFELVYPLEEAPDVEAFFVYPRSRAVGFVTKEGKKKGKHRIVDVFAAPLPRKRLPAEGRLELSRVASLRLSGKGRRARVVTAATVTGEGELVVLSYGRLRLFPLPPEPGQPVTELRPRTTIELPLQLTEACTVTGKGRVLVGAEGRPARFVELPIPR